MKTINIKYMSDDAVATLKENSKTIRSLLLENPDNSDWLNKYFDDNIYVEKKYTIDDFELKEDDINYKNVRFDNAIILYEHLKDLPRYILTDEKFWLWIIFEKGYKQALSSMPINLRSKIFDNYWLFGSGSRNGSFGVLSRDFFVVDLTYDPRQIDPYKYSKIAIDQWNQFRPLLWRSYSNNKHIVLSILKARELVKPQLEKLGITRTNKLHLDVAKSITKIGGIKFLDVMSEDDLIKIVYDKYIELSSEI